MTDREKKLLNTITKFGGSPIVSGYRTDDQELVDSLCHIIMDLSVSIVVAGQTNAKLANEMSAMMA